MTSEDLRRSYRNVRPDEDSRARMLTALLEENESWAARSRSAERQRRRRRLLPAACAAVLVALAVLSPLLRPAPVEENPPQRPVVSAPAPRPEQPPLQSAPPPAVVVTPPKTFTWNGTVYALLPEVDPQPQELGDPLAEEEGGTLYRFSTEDSKVVLERRGQLFLYAPVP